MTVQAFQVEVSHGQFILEGLDADLAEPQYTGGNGLVWASQPPPDGTQGSTAAVVMTGTFYGTVPVTAAVHDRAPEPGTGAWDEVVEVSVTVTGSTLYVYAPAGPEQAAEVTLPASPGQARSYRLRVHARGRDHSEDPPGASGMRSTEEYLVLIWPAPPAPETCLKLTDNTGAHIRNGGEGP